MRPMPATRPAAGAAAPDIPPAAGGAVLGDGPAGAEGGPEALAGQDQARGRRVVPVHAAGREGCDFEERAAGVEEGLDALARQELAARDVLGACGLAAAGRGERLALLQLGNEAIHVCRVLAELRAASIHARRDSRHGAVARSSSRPISMRRISLVPAPISYSLASRRMRPAGYSLM